MSSHNCPLGLMTAISAAAVAIAKNLSDEEAALLSSVLTQLGDTLNTILVQKECIEALSEENEAIRGKPPLP